MEKEENSILIHRGEKEMNDKKKQENPKVVIKNIFDKLPKTKKVKHEQQKALKNQLRKFNTTVWKIDAINSLALIYLHEFPDKLPEEILQEFNERRNKPEEEDSQNEKTILNLSYSKLFDYHLPTTDEGIKKTLHELDRFNNRELFVGVGHIFNTQKTGHFPKETIFDLLEMKENLEKNHNDKAIEIFDFNRVINSLHLVMVLLFLEAFVYESMKIILYYDFLKLVKKPTKNMKLLIKEDINDNMKTEKLIESYLAFKGLITKINLIDQELDIYIGFKDRKYTFIQYTNLIRNLVVHKGGVIDNNFITKFNELNMSKSLRFPGHTEKEIGALIPVTDLLISELLSTVESITGYLTLNIMKQYLGFKGIESKYKLKMFPDK